ncbi:hypothetical protein V6N11_077499 [Hibiscus sabdariffa]|uniref:Uncharacterized protein n=1 Tax=Hibiscus sabdariffa TaxID=183260 RepID=A0ABR2TDE9_9ROSI
MMSHQLAARRIGWKKKRRVPEEHVIPKLHIGKWDKKLVLMVFALFSFHKNKQRGPPPYRWIESDPTVVIEANMSISSRECTHARTSCRPTRPRAPQPEASRIPKLHVAYNLWMHASREPRVIFTGDQRTVVDHRAYAGTGHPRQNSAKVAAKRYKSVAVIDWRKLPPSPRSTCSF